MKTTLALQSTHRFANRLKLLREQRRQGKIAGSTKRRQALTNEQRDLILSKTGGRCHICGGKIKNGEKWQADHVLAHAYGGEHSIENYLAAHSICNHCRWHYGAEEFRWIMKLGIWLRTLIESRDNLAMALAERFIRHERHRITRQKSNSVNSVVKLTMQK